MLQVCTLRTVALQANLPLVAAGNEQGGDEQTQRSQCRLD